MSRVRLDVQLVAIVDGDREAFTRLAIAYFQDLDPSFEPRAEWLALYFPSLLSNPQVSPRWIVSDGRRAGFAILGVKPHRFLPSTVGVVEEFYIGPSYRRRGIGRLAAQAVLRELHEGGATRVDLEVYRGNAAAAAFWEGLGFERVAERFVRRAGPG
jgi:ribosomal protein S18 acetylase RimI-like enzyme